MDTSRADERPNGCCELVGIRRRRMMEQSNYIRTDNYLSLIHLLVIVAALNLVAHHAAAANLPINNRTVKDWLVVDLMGNNTYKPMFVNNYSVVPHDDVSHWPVDTYYWQAPEPYYQWKIYTYGGDLKFLVNHIVTRGDTAGKYLDEPDLVLEGGSKERHLKIGYRLAKEDDMLRGYDKNQTIRMPLTEDDWFYLAEDVEDERGVKRLKLGDVPVSRADFSLVLAGLDRSLIRAKYHMDQVEGDLYDVNMHLAGNKSRTIECNNDCSGLLLDDLDDIGLLFDEIRRLAAMFKDGLWRRLAHLTNRTNELDARMAKYRELLNRGKELIENYSLNFDQEALAHLLELRAGDLDSRAPAIALEAYQTRLLAERTLEELLKGLWDKIRRTISLLNEHGFGPGGVSPAKIERLVQESEIILNELRKRNLKPFVEDAERELRKAKQQLDKIRTLLIDPDKSAELKKRLEQLNKILVDFSRIVQEQVLKPVNEANALVQEGKRKYELLLALLKDSDDRARDSQSALDEARRLLEIARKCHQSEELYLEALPRQLVDLNNSIHEIEVKRSILTQVNPDYQKKYVDRCREHGDQLVKKSRQLDGLFNATRDVADFALRAANVYKNIASAIDGADQAARRALDAADKAYKMAVPDFDESLADKARESKRKSLELLARAEKLRDVQRLSLELAKRRLDQLFEQVKSLANELDQINAGLKQLADKNYYDQLAEIDAFVRGLFERLANVHRRLQLLADLIMNQIVPQYESLSAGSQSSLGNLSQVIEGARKDLLAAIKYASNSKASLEKLLRLEAKLDLDLDLLRRKIQLAHQEATSVHVSVMPSSESGVCARSYFIPALLSATQNALQVGGFGIRHISLVWSLHSDEAESLLLFVGSKSGDQFLAVEMYERHIRLVYSLGANDPVQSLSHPKKIELNDKGLLSDDAWYLIQVEVSEDSEQIRLSVKSVPGAHDKDGQQVSQRLAPSGGGGSSSRLQVSAYGEAEINFMVGGLPPGAEFSSQQQLKSSRLTGCLYDLTLNQHQVGLWNFKTNVGCDGCMEGPLDARDLATFSFTGTNSYATVAHSRFYDRTKHMVSLSAKTSDSDALLYLAMSETSNHYMSIQLTGGRVAYLIGKIPPPAHHMNYLSLSSASSIFNALNAHLNGSQSAAVGQQSGNQQQQQQQLQPTIEHVIVTEREYNNGQWFKITAEKEQSKLVLAVEEEFRESVADEKLAALDVDQLFFGGVWPMVRPAKYANTSLQLRSYSGCLKDIQIETSPVDLLRRQSYGVETGCSAGGQQGRRRALLTSVVAYPLPFGK